MNRIISKRDIFIVVVILIMCGIIFWFQLKKVGVHEDEVYSISSAVNPNNGLMLAYDNNVIPENEPPTWKTREYVQEYMTLTKDNYFNIKSIYNNQKMDNHPPLFYVLVHFSAILFSGEFTKYTIFLVNIIMYVLSCLIIVKLLKLINKENIIIGTLIFYGLSIGTISMVLYQRMYMTLTFFILLYFYYNIKVYKNEFNIDKKLIIKLGITTVLGFLTQYFFAIYASIIFLIMIIKMAKVKNKKAILKYVAVHIICAVVGILLFIPSILHLLFSDRGISNFGNSNYLTNLGTYIKHLTYAFSITELNMILFIVLLVFFIKKTYLCKKADERFVVLVAIVPSIIYFLITVKLTSYQELRYIMPVVPFIVISLFIILDILIRTKFKNVIIMGISILATLNGLIFSKPKFLYEEYSEFLRIAKQNSKKSYVYIYDNFFNHMKNIPEMMIYEKTLIINTNKNELDYLIENEELNKEESYILSIKSYMNNNEIIEKIKTNTPFKNITELYISDYGASDKQVENNLYLVSK